MSNVWLIGCGAIALQYFKILRRLNIESIRVIGRSDDSASRFEAETQFPVLRGGLSKQIGRLREKIDVVIIATQIEELAGLVKLSAEAGAERILVEKPGGKSFKQIQELLSLTETSGSKTFVAYNRRFFSSVKALRSLVKAEGGIKSIHFEFTELSFRDQGKLKNWDPLVTENWVLANSSHVLDLAFFLGSPPSSLNCVQSGYLGWHKTGARFAGSGMSTSGVLYSYFADWECPGRWGLEVLTKESRYLLKPLEKLQKYVLGEFQPQNVPLIDDLDHEFKPGYFAQTQEFICGNTDDLCSLEDHVSNCRWFVNMAGY